ncbi:MAG: hypothetical protein OHK0052_12690 [Anaerolineales bacterium]
MELTQQLIELGFSEYEARVYLALLRESPLNGYQISKNAGIPRSMVYEALGRLDTRGAVLKSEEERATLYRPLPPDALLDRHQRQQQTLIENLRSGLQALFTAQNDQQLWNIQGETAALDYASQLIREAQTELMLVLNNNDLNALRGTIQQTAKRGVKVGALLTGDGNLDCCEIAYHPPSESEAHQLTDMLVVVADNTHTLIVSRSPETTATLTRNRNITLIARQFVWMELFTQRLRTQMQPILQQNPTLRQQFSAQDLEILLT